MHVNRARVAHTRRGLPRLVRVTATGAEPHKGDQQEEGC